MNTTNAVEHNLQIIYFINNNFFYYVFYRKANIYLIDNTDKFNCEIDVKIFLIPSFVRSMALSGITKNIHCKAYM